YRPYKALRCRESEATRKRALSAAAPPTYTRYDDAARWCEARLKSDHKTREDRTLSTYAAGFREPNAPFAVDRAAHRRARTSEGVGMLRFGRLTRIVLTRPAGFSLIQSSSTACSRMVRRFWMSLLMVAGTSSRRRVGKPEFWRQCAWWAYSGD